MTDARREMLAQLRAAAPAVLPSMLLCDFARLGEEIARLEEAGAPALHLDVMDGHFTANFTYGLTIVAAARRCTSLPLDVHLMTANPGRYVREFRDAGADLLTIHIEAATDPRPVLEQIRAVGAGAGLALNPDTPLDQATPFLDACDLVLVMSVPAGFGGQPFDRRALDKLRRLREAKGGSLLLEVDGGVSEATIASCAEAGAELFVVGSSIFKFADYGQRIAALSQLARGGNGSG